MFYRFQAKNVQKVVGKYVFFRFKVVKFINLWAIHVLRCAQTTPNIRKCNKTRVFWTFWQLQNRISLPLFGYFNIAIKRQFSLQYIFKNSAALNLVCVCNSVQCNRWCRLSNDKNAKTSQN